MTYRIKTVPDQNKDRESDRLIKNMVKFILVGISPVKELLKVPEKCRENSRLSHSRPDDFGSRSDRRLKDVHH